MTSLTDAESTVVTVGKGVESMTCAVGDGITCEVAGVLNGVVVSPTACIVGVTLGWVSPAARVGDAVGLALTVVTELGEELGAEKLSKSSSSDPIAQRMLIPTARMTSVQPQGQFVCLRGPE